MNQLGLFEAAPPPSAKAADPYAIDHGQVGGALRPFVRFCKERLGAHEGEIHLSLIPEEAWKRGRHHPYIKAWDAYQGAAA